MRSVVGDVLDRGDGSWVTLREAGLVSLVAPEAFGGEGLGMSEVSVILHEIGRRASDLPAWETIACGLLPLLRSGSAELQAELVPLMLDGSLLLVPALNEPGAALPQRPATTFDGTVVTGVKTAVRHLDEQHLVIVSATASDGSHVSVLVDPQDADATPTSSSRGTAEVTYRFDGARVRGVLDGEVVRDHAIAGLVPVDDPDRADRP